ncbi:MULTISPECIES: hypothetical protein [unclassified Duganella]|uniref:hypothetical protein n=1 Tax=unclassified Duganella TaxID=2636909 RepID=UPI000882B45B|nr:MULTISPECIES: hypothetical protein [unclassified Duganella]SDH43992.1 hypothetical protein SAMN05216320_11396 [Duganella sp. OV458]SDK58489.1 hypothetical protein SAMN05428973_11366 [Duganella sp. OV510]
MKLVPTSECALRLIGSPLGQGMPQSELMLNRQSTGVIIDGAVLEVAIRWHDLLLVFVTDDIMHEDTLRIYLFDARLDLVDSAKLGWMYATGAFSLLELCPPNTVRFLFFGDTDWTLELFNTDVFAIPFISEPRGVSKPLRFHRRFQVTGDPKPEAPQSSVQKLMEAPAKSEDQSESLGGRDRVK